MATDLADVEVKHFHATEITRGVAWVFTTSDWHLNNRRLLRDAEQIGDTRRRDYTVKDAHPPAGRGSDGPSYHSDPSGANLDALKKDG